MDDPRVDFLAAAVPAVAGLVFLLLARRSRRAARAGLAGVACLLVHVVLLLPGTGHPWLYFAPASDPAGPPWTWWLLALYGPTAAGYLLLARAVVLDRPPADARG